MCLKLEAALRVLSDPSEIAVCRLRSNEKYIVVLYPQTPNYSKCRTMSIFKTIRLAMTWIIVHAPRFTNNDVFPRPLVKSACICTCTLICVSVTPIFDSVYAFSLEFTVWVLTRKSAKFINFSLISSTSWDKTLPFLTSGSWSIFVSDCYPLKYSYCALVFTVSTQYVWFCRATRFSSCQTFWRCIWRTDRPRPLNSNQTPQSR